MALESSYDPRLVGVTGTRIDWPQVPSSVRDAIENRLGAQLVTARTQVPGFSPALAARLTLTGGGRVFVKAIGPDEESGAPGGQDSYRREARITAELPDSVPAPGLVKSWEADGWVVLVFEDVDGHNPAYPWHHGELVRVLRAVAQLSDSLTPSPVNLPGATTPGGRSHWSVLAAEPHPMARLPGLDPWVRANVDRLDAVVGALTGFAGFMIHGATQPPPAGLPTLPAFQLAQGIEAIAWLRQMTR